MGRTDKTSMGGRQEAFETTHWTEIVRVREGNIDDWHWQRGDIKGDAGGLSGAVALSYLFLR